MNTVGPYDNRQETYAYFSLPFCQGTKQSIGHYHETLSEALQGVELEHSGYAIDFRGKNDFHTSMIRYMYIEFFFNATNAYQFANLNFPPPLPPYRRCTTDGNLYG